MAKNSGVGPMKPSIMEVKNVGPLPGKNVPPPGTFPSHAAPIATAIHQLQKMGSVTPPDTVMHRNKGNTSGI